MVERETMRALPPPAHFVTGGMPIYTHFLNRELLRSVNLGLNDGTIATIFRILLACTTEHFLSSIAFVWEVSSYLPQTLALIESLYRAKELVLVSNLPTVDEFISSSQTLYSYDSDRYPMYFESIPSALLSMEPGLLKEQNTTGVMATELFAWSQGTQGYAWDLMSSTDKSRLQRLRKLIISVLNQKEEKGITLSLFEETLSKNQLGGNKLPLARLLSLIHLQHYLTVIGADIPTGIRGLTYFDIVSHGYPTLDVELLDQILRRIISQIVIVSPNFLEIFLQTRGSPPHRAFVQSLRYIINGALYVTQKRYPGFNSGTQRYRYLLAETLHDVLNFGVRSRAKPTAGSDIIAIAYADLINIGTMARKDPTFAEFADIWDMVKRMNHSKVLLLTATDLETETVMQVAKGLGLHHISRMHIEDHTIYNVGTLAGTDIFLAQSEMGTEAPGSMTLTANDVVRALNPHSIVLIGISFGMKEDEQKIGDVLVSKQISLYDPKKLKIVDGKEVWGARGDRVQASTRLLDRFHSGRLEWNRCKIHFGLILSGNTLVNSPEFIKKLKDIEPDAIGGEMEGAGIYAVGAKRKIDWIVVKGIADWGINKSDEFQREAALNAVSFTFHVISTGALAA